MYLGTAGLLFFSALSAVFSSKALSIISFVSWALTAISMMLLTDIISRERYNVPKLVVMIILCTLYIQEAIVMEDHVTIYLGADYLMSYTVLWYHLIITLIMQFVWLYYNYKIYRHSPPEIKTFAFLALLSPILFAINIPVNVFLPKAWFNTLTFSLGCIVGSYAYAKEPKLACVLLFQAYRITIIDTNGGLTLFSHTWQSSRTLVQSDLFSGMIHGITVLMRESLESGNITSINMESGVIFMEYHPKYPVACVLVADKAIMRLKQALTEFSNEFFSRFEKHFSNINFSTPFDPASELVEKYFPFVPQYSEDS